MDPIATLLDLIRAKMPDSTALEAQIGDLMARFELVPKHEYEAHMALLTTLQTQVQSLESRLEDLEKTT
ncbi:MAG: accessory factor UbiK family protein [Gammaproteobacteria bacterium]|nr:accessory factor UbiK family protein [Gammaproteobacteria bacterium]